MSTQRRPNSHQRRAEKLAMELTAARADVVQLRATLDGADCTRREGGDTRHCGLNRPCWHCQADAAREESARLRTVLEAIRHEAKDALTWGRANAALASTPGCGDAQLQSPVIRRDVTSSAATRPEAMSPKAGNGDMSTPECPCGHGDNPAHALLDHPAPVEGAKGDE